MRRLSILLLPLLLLAASCARTEDSFDIRQFKNPPATYRSITFYSLNDSLSADRVRKQLGQMKEGGFGGAFLHSRPGLLTPYLSDEWFDIMEVSVDECRKLGLEAWFYDEDKWPSGFAGGIVPLMDDGFRARTLVQTASGVSVEAPDSILYDDGRTEFICHLDPLGQAWYNGTCWVDLMNPAMVKAFLDCSYEPYIRRFAGRKGVHGMFSDEPQISPRTDFPGAHAYISYSPGMEKAFKDAWGYDMDPCLPSLTDTVGDWRRFRLHYYRTAAACMESAFSSQMARYCADHGFIWTGHYNSEESPSSNMRNEGNLSIQLRNMEIPGIDALGLRFKELHNGKVMTSVANQYGRRRRIVEIFGISGHNMSFEDRMWLTAWHTNCGVNMQCPHLTLYSMKGVRKRDYPPTFSAHQPYWSKNRLYEDFGARMCYFATCGRTVGEVCVISPLESDYITTDISTYTNGTSPSDRLMESILQKLAAHQLNSDLGDEQIIADAGAVRDGRFVIGEASYHTVILPHLITIRPSTLSLLEEFAKAGGRVIVCEEYPSFLDGVPDGMEGLRACSEAVGVDGIDEALDALPRQFSLSGEGRDKIWTHLRSVAGGNTLQLSNTSRHGSVRVRVSFGDSPSKLVLMNPVNGEVLEPGRDPDGSFVLDFAPAQSWIVAFGARTPAPERSYRLPPDDRTPILTLDNQWKLTRNNPNTLPLDFAEWSVDGGRSWEGPEPVLAIYTRFEGRDKYDGPMMLRYTFDVSQLPGDCALAVEQPQMYRSASLNGRPLSFGQDYLVDEDFRKADLTSLLRKGRNEVVLELDFVSPRTTSLSASERYGTEIETVYLCGDFGVKGELASEQPSESWRNRNPILNPKPLPLRYRCGSFSICDEPAEVAAGDLTLDAYPFFAGSVTYGCSFSLDTLPDAESIKLAFPRAEAILVDVRINGKELPTVFCSPWEADVTSAVRPGENSVEITLTGSLRNLMGPSHHVGGEFAMTGPAVFSGADSWPNYEKGDNDWFELRKSGKTRLWRDDYYCVPFGLMEPPVLIAER